MKSRFFPIRFKIVMTFFASAAIAFLCTLFLLVCFGAFAAIDNKLLVWINKNYMLAMPLIFLAASVVFFLLMSLIFILMTQRGIWYLNEIMGSLTEISRGNFDVSIPKRTSDELGELSEIINGMAYKIRTLIEEERNWEKSKIELINNVSHDLRTPLTSTLGYLELIAEHKYADEAALQHYAEIAHSKCMSLKKLIDDLFEYSKLSSSELKINKTKVNLGELLEQVIVGFMPIVLGAGMEFRMFFDKPGINIAADPVLIARLFDNLINNAVSYGREGRYIDVELTQRVNEAVVRIINYGETISEEELPYIFERFYRVEKSRSRSKGGAGLGLAIVRSIAGIHGGSVTASSKDGKTVFEVRLKT